ncbi:MAG TPA: ATP-binding protein [Kofleriaceae bacterium]|nr:ATP-binding protein [Kofleriaceae bacterium]
MEAFDVLARLTARVASTARIDEIVDAALDEIVALGFGIVWVAMIDEQTGNLATLKSVAGGADLTHQMPRLFMLDGRQPLGVGFRERRFVNITDPGSLHILERDDEVVPAGKLAVSRATHERTRGTPFACGPLLGSNGDPVGALCMSDYRGGQPIPDELFARGVLRAIIDLVPIAIERTRHLAKIEQLDANQRRIAATIASEAPTKAVGEIAGAVAHDLNNLSTIALVAASAGARSPADAVEAMPRIESAIKMLGELVAQLQRIARRPTGGGDTANLAQIVDDILAMVKPLLNEHSIKVDAELPALPPVRCDPVVIHRVVLNLVVNARDALAEVPDDRRWIRVRARADSGVVRLTLADTGPGIAPEVFANLFQPHFTTKSTGHFGLGLSSGRAALAQHDGQLEAKNAPTGGAVFELTLMAAQPEAPTPEAPASSGATTHTRGARILALDDSEDVLEVIQICLEPYGHEMSTVTTSAQALEAAAAREFDLVLCDLGMPKPDGLDVARELRARGYRGKIVLMTGWDTPMLGSDVRAAACDTLLKKPFVCADLIHVIDTLLAR